MKTFRSAILLAALVGCVTHGHAALNSFTFNNGFANGGVVPDGNATGWFDTRTLAGIADGSITDVDVHLNIAGGYNGDFYGYLSHSSGFSVLLNRPGRTSGNSVGYGNAGLSILLNDSAANGDIHLYQSVPGYAVMIGNGSDWSPDGRNVDPTMVLNTDSRTLLLDQFNGLNPNGDWTLFVADLSSGEQGTVVSWGLNITAVPEPSSVCLLVLGAAAALGARRRKL